ncbi:hypothetical protein Mapa_011937 [Marchantia paleacea]|nr:hypothetical protein Mapa_011937 [Marchantia paleacea]
MDVSEVNQAGPLEAVVSEEQKAVAVAPAEATDTPDQQRGVKRSRRDRGSTAKDRISKMPPCAAGKRSSIYRGVTRHRWTGRYEAHLWDKSTWNQTQNKKGKQGAYDEEEAAARAYDLAALKYWGPGTLINFPVSDYARDIEEMQNVTREEYLASLRRKSSGFSRGVSKYRGVARHHHNGRWEARIGRVFGNKYLYLGTYSTQEEAAAAYDMAAIEYRGLNAVTNFDLSRYIRWLRPGQGNSALQEPESNLSPVTGDESQLLVDEQCQAAAAAAAAAAGEEPHPPVWPAQSTEPYQLPALGLASNGSQQQQQQQRSSSSPTALSLLLQSSMFKQMLERASSASGPTDCDSTTPSSDMGMDPSGAPQQQQQHPSSHFFSTHQAPPLVEDDSSEHQDVSSYLFSNPTTSSNHHHHHHLGMYGDLPQQDHLSAYASFPPGGPSSLPTDSEGVAASLDDGSAYWSFGGALPLNPITSC